MGPRDMSALCRVVAAGLVPRLCLLAEHSGAAWLLSAETCRSVSTSSQQHDQAQRNSNRRGGSSKRPKAGTPQQQKAPPPAPSRPLAVAPRLGRVPPVAPSQLPAQQHAAVAEQGDDDFVAHLASRLLQARQAAAPKAGAAAAHVGSPHMDFGAAPTVASVLRQMHGSDTHSPEALASYDAAAFADYLRDARMGAPSVFDMGVTVSEGREMRALLLRWERLLKALHPHEAAHPADLDTQQLAAAAARSGVPGAEAEAVAGAIMDWAFFRRACELMGLQRRVWRAGGATISPGLAAGPPVPGRTVQSAQQQGPQQPLQHQWQQAQGAQQLLQQEQAGDVAAEELWQEFHDWTLVDFARYIAMAQQGVPTIFAAGSDEPGWQEAAAQKLQQSTSVLQALVGVERARPLFLSAACIRDIAATAGVPATIAREVLNDFYKLKRLGFNLAAQRLTQATGHQPFQQQQAQQQQAQAPRDIAMSSAALAAASEAPEPEDPAQESLEQHGSAGAAAGSTDAAESTAAAESTDEATTDLAPAKELLLQELEEAASMSLDGFAAFLAQQRRLGLGGFGVSRAARLQMLRMGRIIAAMTAAEKAAAEEAAAAKQHAAGGEPEAGAASAWDAAAGAVRQGMARAWGAVAAGEDSVAGAAAGGTQNGAMGLAQEQLRAIADRCSGGVSVAEVEGVLQQYSAARQAAAEVLLEQRVALQEGGS